jgi:hypothetical protein
MKRKPRAITYDTKCYVLAQQFCADLQGANESTVHELAQCIQQTCEEFFEDIRQQEVSKLSRWPRQMRHAA